MYIIADHWKWPTIMKKHSLGHEGSADQQFYRSQNKEYFVNTINYCRAKYIKEAIEEIIKIKSIPEENEFSIYSEQEFVLDSWMDYPKSILIRRMARRRLPLLP